MGKLLVDRESGEDEGILEPLSPIRSTVFHFRAFLLALGFLAGLQSATIVAAAETQSPVATFSFVAHDPESGISGVIVASKFFAVGSVVPWANAGAGAIATQAHANTTFGPKGIELLTAGKNASETLAALLEDDEGRESRQVGIVDEYGGSATHTGKECMDWAGGRSGPGWAAQGNILTGPEVVDQMAESFQSTAGEFLGDRLMAALEAGDAAGGDSRGRQSAALYLVAEGKGYAGFNDILCDIRVDDHADPIAELRRVYNVWLPNHLIYEGYRLVEEGMFEEAIRQGRRAAELDPDSGEPYYHLACYYSRSGDAGQAMHYLGWAVELNSDLKKQAKTDPDLGPLRHRSDWSTIVSN